MTAPKSEESVLNFPLAELVGFDRSVFLNDPKYEALDGFVLSLALAFNDFKTMMWVWSLLDEFKPEEPKGGAIEKKFGQFVGMRWHILRLLVGNFVELRGLISANQPLFEETIWVRTLRKLSNTEAKSWNSVVEFDARAKTKGTWENKFHSLLEYVRNNGTFHYAQNQPLIRGYKRAFTKEGLGAAYAYASLGKNLEESRFYFADAAVVEMFKDQAEKLWKEFERDFHVAFRDYTRDVNSCIRGLVDAYMNVRQIKRTLVERTT
jgi:hypothetical protein